VRVIIDTNVIVSRLLISGSVSARAVDKAITEADVMTSDATVGELVDVLARKKLDRYVTIEERQEFVRRFLQITSMIPVISEIDDCKDPADNHFLALALDAEASCIVTGDKALLALSPWRDIVILSPSEFLSFELGP
jgi:putative PIN family toxin of toxin-antitoxin system